MADKSDSVHRKLKRESNSSGRILIFVTSPYYLNGPLPSLEGSGLVHLSNVDQGLTNSLEVHLRALVRVYLDLPKA